VAAADVTAADRVGAVRHRRPHALRSAVQRSRFVLSRILACKLVDEVLQCVQSGFQVLHATEHRSDHLMVRHTARARGDGRMAAAV